MKFQPDKPAEIIVTMNGQGASITPPQTPAKPAKLKPTKVVHGNDMYAAAARSMISFYFRGEDDAAR